MNSTVKSILIIVTVLFLAGMTNATAVVVTTGAELQKALYSVTSGETIYLKAGYYAPPDNHYYFDVNRSVTIKAYGDGQVIIDANGKTGGFRIITSNVTIDGLGMMTILNGSYGVELEKNASNVAIQNLKIDCAGKAYFGIYDLAQHIDNLTIKNVKIVKPLRDGVYLYDGFINYYTKDVVIDNLTVIGAKGNGLYACTVGTDSRNISIVNSKFIGCSGSGIDLINVKGNATIKRTIVTGNPTGIYVTGESMTFISNYIAGNDIGAKIYTPKFVAQGNIIKNNAHYGLYISGTGTAEIYNSEFDNNSNGAYTGGAAIYLTRGRVAEIHNCNILINNNRTIYNSQSTDVNAQNNYWGTNNTTLINRKIVDSNDYSYLGTVYYVPILTSPAVIIPTPVPEFLTIVLAAIGFATMIILRRRF